MRVDIRLGRSTHRVRTVVLNRIVVNDILRLANAHGVAHLVHDVQAAADQKHIARAKQGGKLFDKGLIQRNHTALALHDLNHHGGGRVGVKQLLHTRKVARRYMVKSCGQRGEIPVENRLPGCRKRGDRPPAYLRATLMAHSLASAPELEKKTLLMPVFSQSMEASTAHGSE